MSVLLIFVLGIALFATLALISAILQNQFHYPMVRAGMATLAQLESVQVTAQHYRDTTQL